MVCSALILTFQFELVVPPSPTRTGGHWKSSKFTFTVCEEAYKARCQASIASLECILTALSFNCSALWLRDDLLGFPFFRFSLKWWTIMKTDCMWCALPNVALLLLNWKRSHAKEVLHLMFMSLCVHGKLFCGWRGCSQLLIHHPFAEIIYCIWSND